MSELKVASLFEFEKVLQGRSNKLFYSKSEADKVIAEKDAKILALDAEVFKQTHHAKLFFDERNYAETQSRHHKYKRCLAMARWCELGISYWDDDEQEGGWEYKKLRHCIRWKKRWLELAEKFKEAVNESNAERTQCT